LVLASVVVAFADEVTLSKISGNECVEVTLHGEDVEYVNNFAWEGLKMGSCTENGYSVEDSTQSFQVPFFPQPLTLRSMRQSSLDVFALKAQAWISEPFQFWRSRTAPARKPATQTDALGRFQPFVTKDSPSMEPLLRGPVSEQASVRRDGLKQAGVRRSALKGLFGNFEGAYRRDTYGKKTDIGDDAACVAGDGQQIPNYCCARDSRPGHQSWFCDAWTSCARVNWKVDVSNSLARIAGDTHVGKCEYIDRYVQAYGTKMNVKWKGLDDTETKVFRKNLMVFVKDFNHRPAGDVVEACISGTGGSSGWVPSILKGRSAKSRSDADQNLNADKFDPEYPGTSLERLENIQKRIKGLKQKSFSVDWDSVRALLLWAGGISKKKPDVNENVDLDMEGMIAGAFNDYKSVDMTPSLGAVLPKGVKLGHLEHATATELGRGTSWVTDGARDDAHTRYRSRIAFKLVWCPPSFNSFVLVDDSGAYLNHGTPIGSTLPDLSIREANYNAVKESKYAVEADKFEGIHGTIQNEQDGVGDGLDKNEEDKEKIRESIRLLNMEDPSVLEAKNDVTGIDASVIDGLAEKRMVTTREEAKTQQQTV